MFGTSSYEGDGYLTWAAWLGTGLPLIGVVVAALGRRRGWTWFFAICLVVAGARWVDDVRHAPPPSPSPEPSHCVERSGGGNECPGG
ncbi:hypothetical protein ACIOD2_23585 [Amycolatopsis sp. NPDC088138]|uniref:hypothetical protein n=1 Tax=Amycolatopsis sp. NPDC088138 TaxID=3363938 RepID=UPI00381BF317